MQPPTTLRFPWQPFRRLLLCCACGWLAFASAAELARRPFDLPSDGAERALKTFSAQAGVEVLFSSDAVAGVRTNGVKGDFTPLEAAKKMLAGTTLYVRDQSNGVIIVATTAEPHADPKAERAAPTEKSVRPIAPIAASGERKPLVGSRPDAAPSAQEAVVLSPFLVNSSQDTGYQATSTLAGTRLNTPLKDLGASISIYTKDFLDDIGATNSSELLIYATGMEAYGPGGNYSGGNGDINDASPREDGARHNPANATRTRGLAAPNRTRGYFPTGIAFDTYNTESVTVNRGPNAALFGVGSPAGVIDVPLLRPDLRRNKNKIEMRYGNNQSLRGSVDFNRVLIKNHLGVRIAALHDREEFNQRPAFEEKKRVYGALTVEPFASTSLRANFETGYARANRPINNLPFNGVSAQWLAAGRPAFDWSFYDDPARNPDAARQIAGNAPYDPGFLIGGGYIGDQIVHVFSNPTDQSPTLAFRSVTQGTGGNDANRVKAQLFNPLVNRDLGSDQIRFYSTSNVFEFPAAFWTSANVPAGQLPRYKPAGLKTQGFTDFSAFDFRNRMIDETTRQGESFHAFNVALEQRGWEDRVGLELAYDVQRIDRRTKHSFFSSGVGGSFVRIDANVTLPNGEPNPNVGRPYAVFGQSAWYSNFNLDEGKRATGFLKYDFEDLSVSWGKWLGRHTLTGLMEERASEAIAYAHRLATDGTAARAIAPDINSASRRARAIVYIGPSIIGNDRPLQLQPIQIAPFNPGPTTLATHFVREANATDPGRFVSTPASFVEINNGGSAARDVIRSQAAVLQSHWLGNHLVTLLGWRRDEDYFVRVPASFVSNPADRSDPGKVHYGFDDFSFPRTPPPNVAKEIKSYSAVLRWPRKLIKLPPGTDFSVFYNRSENFTPLGGRINGFGESLERPRGATKEFGFNLWAFSDKLSLRVNRFETAVERQTFTPGVYNAAANSAIFGTAANWAVEGNINPHLVEMRNADIELLFSPLPANLRQVYAFQINGSAPNLSVSRTDFLSGFADTTDFTAKGSEIELVYNPAPNWRILMNVAKQETVKTNSMPFLKDFMARMQPVWNQLKDRPYGNYPLGWRPGDPLPANLVTYGDWLDANVRVPFATELATEGVASAEQRKWRANFITNYTFDRESIFGRYLKGWGIGGAVRWQDKLGLGYPMSRNADSSVNVDLAHPYYAPSETNVDAWVSYQRKLWKARITWKVQLNVRNLLGSSTPIAIGVQPWGEISTVRLAPERRWYLTNTFSF